MITQNVYTNMVVVGLVLFVLLLVVTWMLSTRPFKKRIMVTAFLCSFIGSVSGHVVALITYSDGRDTTSLLVTFGSAILIGGLVFGALLMLLDLPGKH